MRFLFWLLRLLFFLLITLLGLLLPVLLFVFRALRDLVSMSFVATVNGPAPFVDRLAGEWTERFHELVDDRGHIYEVYQIFRFIAGALIVLGWVVATFFTVEILRVYFAFFI